MMRHLAHLRLPAAVAALTFAVDQATKLYVVWYLDLATRLFIDVWPPFLTFRMAWNRGINFGLLAHDADLARWALVALALAISGFVALWIGRGGQGRRARVSAGLLIGGALGNVVDRIAYGAVADFLNMSCCGIDNPFAFNVADAAIFAGALGLVAFARDGRPDAGGPRNTP